ncbi:APC family permease [Motilibacter deserti]|uniref:Amino acid permease n=1 Tax=Motilibacter deserti TaxID=2714956 RepID=A0ABX0GVY5_9ACTN|nr:APC family permease [Motilibacter deserti]NHC13787.1 amino acid permease [Motilibacter deserti]
MTTIAPDAGAEPSAAGGGLKRVMGRRMLLLFIVGDILGAGIYTLTGKVAGEVGGAIWLPFLVAFALAFLTATAYAELVGKYPKAAGAALYVNRAVGRPFVTFMVAFAVMASGITSASAAARGFGGDYLAEFVTLPVVLVAVAFVLVLAAVNLLGTKESVRCNLVLTLIELGGLLLVIVVGVAALVQGDGDVSRATDFSGKDGALLGALGGAALAFYALLGFEDSVNMAEEVESPHSAFPKALFVGLLLTGAVYLAVSLVATLLVPTDELAGSTGPLLEVVRAGGIDVPAKAFALIALIAVTNTALLNMLMASRVVYGMANEGIVPKVFASVHATRHTPWLAIAVTSLIALVLVATGDLAGLADTTVLLLLLVFAAVNVSVLVLRREHVEHPHFHAPTWAPALGAVASLVLASPLTGRESGVYVRAGVLLAIGVALWVANHLFVRRQAPDAAALSGS